MRRTETVRQPLVAAPGENGPVTAETARPGLLAKAVYRLDARLRKKQGVFEYSSHADCIFRIQIDKLRESISLVDGTCLAAGDRIITLHVWNEQIPPLPRRRVTLKWARALSHKLELSMRELARFLKSRPDLADIEAIRANMALGPPKQTPTILQLSSRYGFDPVSRRPIRRATELLHRLGENILIAMLVLARNPAAWGWNDLARDRVEVVITRSKLMSLHGASN